MTSLANSLLTAQCVAVLSFFSDVLDPLPIYWTQCCHVGFGNLFLQGLNSCFSYYGFTGKTV